MRMTDDEKRRQLEARRRRFDEEEDDVVHTKHSMLLAVQKMEHLRSSLRHAAVEFEEMLEDSPDLAELWNSFVKMGGVGSHDLERHLAGKIIRVRSTRTKKHLRLISSRPTKPVTVRRRRDDDDDAA
jgi:hypothetical protein